MRTNTHSFFLLLCSLNLKRKKERKSEPKFYVCVCIQESGKGRERKNADIRPRCCEPTVWWMYSGIINEYQQRAEEVKKRQKVKHIYLTSIWLHAHCHRVIWNVQQSTGIRSNRSNGKGKSCMLHEWENIDYIQHHSHTRLMIEFKLTIIYWPKGLIANFLYE